MNQDLLTFENIDISVQSFIINLLVAFILSYLLSLIYVKYSNSLSNKKIFSNNFYLISLTTVLIITVVKSSLALSLGLVGALSIVRFRAAIKEPEEIAYLFLCIAIGLGIGANYTVLTVVGFFFIASTTIIINIFTRKDINHEEMFCAISLEAEISINEVLSIFKKYSNTVFLRDFDISEKFSQLGVIISFKNSEDINSLAEDLRDLYKEINIKFLNKQGLG